MDTAFCGIISGMIPKPVPHRIRSQVDDTTISLTAHDGKYMPACPHHCPKVAVDRRLERFRRVVEKGANDAAARIIDQNVDCTKSLMHRIDQLMRYRLQREVAG